jgi:hypothetical protein
MTQLFTRISESVVEYKETNIQKSEAIISHPLDEPEIHSMRRKTRVEEGKWNERGNIANHRLHLPWPIIPGHIPYSLPTKHSRFAGEKGVEEKKINLGQCN